MMELLVLQNDACSVTSLYDHLSYLMPRILYGNFYFLINFFLNFSIYFFSILQMQKVDNNSKIGRPPGTGPKGSAPAGPNSGRKWVHRSAEVGASAGAGAGGSEGSSETRQSAIIGKSLFNASLY